MQGGKSSNYARMLNEEDNNNYSRQCPGPKRLGVTFLASEWGSSKGGLSTLNRELAINIAKDPRVKVSYFVPSCNDEDKTAAHSHKIELIKAARRPGLDELEWLNFPPKDLQIDVVVGHGVKLGHQAQIIRESHECKWIQVVHTDPEELGIYKEYANPISNAQKKHKTEVELCELADFVVPVGPKLYKAFRSYLASCEKEQCFFEFTPGILAEFSELKQSLEKREVCKVLCFGRGDSEDFKLKGFDIAARAMAKLSHCILLFVGAAEGKLEETQTRFLDFDILPSQLRVRPFLDSREDLKKVFCEADLVVMPSRTEGFGLTGLEALSAGLPILVSRKSGFAEALLKIPFGRHFVVDSDDQDQWAKAIGEVCNNDRSSRLEECETLRDTYKKKYSWKKQCESLIDKMISITLDDKPEDCACAAEKSTLPHQTEVNNGLCSDKPEDCACAAEKSTLPHQTEVSNGLCSDKPEDCACAAEKSTWPHQTEVNNGLCSVSAHSAPGKLPIRIKLNRATFQESQSKDPAQEEEAKRLLMCEMTKHFIEIHAAQIPSKKFSQSLCYYLQGVHDLMIREAGEGSLRIVVECKTLEILEHLWDDYSSGHLNEVAEERLLTDEIKKKYDVESIELETTITMEDYLACKLSLRDLNRDSTVAENLTDPANAHSLVVHDEEQRELTTARFSLNLDSGRSARPNEFHPEQENGSLRLVSEMLSEEKTSQSSSMELPTYFRHVTVTQDSAPTKERDNSLQFSVGCRDLESLELLWSDYRSGRLDWMAEKFLLTDDIKKRFHVESVTLETSILEEDYLACKEHLLNISQQEMKELIVSEDLLRNFWSPLDIDYTLPSSMPNFLTSAWNDESHDKGDVIDPRTSFETQLQLLDIIDGVGTCWRELGLKLDISALEVQKLDEGYRSNREKANTLLLMWKEREGRRAVAGRLVDALRSIGRESIADKLLEYCTEISRRTCEVSHRQLYDIIDDVDTCWRELGPKLNISEVDVQKLDEEFPYNRNKAMTLLFMWKEREGRRAVAGLLADALLSIGRKDIAEKLLGLQKGEGSSYIMDTYKSRRYSKDDEGQNSKLSTAHGLKQRELEEKRLMEASLARRQLSKSAHKFKGLQEGKVSSDILDTSKIRRYSKDGKDDDKKSKLYTAHRLKPDSSISGWSFGL